MTTYFTYLNGEYTLAVLNLIRNKRCPIPSVKNAGRYTYAVMLF